MFAYQPALGAPVFAVPRRQLLALVGVRLGVTLGGGLSQPFAIADLIVLTGLIAGICVAALGAKKRRQLAAFGKNAWAKFTDAEAAGLFASQGTVLGKLDGEILAFDGPDINS